MKNPKLVFVYPTDPLGSKVGGVETFIRDFIKYAPLDFDISFIGINSTHKDRPLKKWTNLNVQNKQINFFPVLFEKDENKKTFIPLSLRFTLALKFSDINLSADILFFNRIESAVLFRKTNAFKIMVIHNDIRQQILQKSEILWSRFPTTYFIFEKFIFNYLNLIYTVSNNTLEFYKLRYTEKKDKFKFLSTWADTEKFYPLSGQKKSIKEKSLIFNKNLSIDKRWVLFVGRLQDSKAPFRLLDSFLDYNDKYRSANLIVIGEGNLKNKMSDYIIKYKAENDIFLLGNMTQKDLADFYRASDVLLLASNYEGMPRCVLEALGSGLPVVSTNVGEVKNIVKNNYSGEIIDSFSPKDISKSLKKVLNNPHVYTKENCLNCVSEYIPEKVLGPVYDMIREL